MGNRSDRIAITSITTVAIYLLLVALDAFFDVPWLSACFRWLSQLEAFIGSDNFAIGGSLVILFTIFVGVAAFERVEDFWKRRNRTRGIDDNKN